MRKYRVGVMVLRCVRFVDCGDEDRCDVSVRRDETGVLQQSSSI